MNHSTKVTRRTKRAGRHMNNNSIANLSFIVCAVVLLNNFIALLVNTEISKTTFNMSIILMILLFINGILHKRRDGN